VICPKCGAEYQPGFTRCSDCLVDLVEQDAQPEATGDPARRGPAALIDAVCVYRSTQRGRLPLAESFLRSAGIPFVASGEHVQQLTGLDVFGPAELYVSAADADDARAMLADLDRQG
jgi:Putative prokaryotic signal transducing protein